MRATASAFFNGHLVHQTHKHDMAYDESGYDRSTMAKAWNRVDNKFKRSCFFTIGNRQFALEICGDHRRAINELNEAPSDSPLKARSDVHILVSKGVAFSPGFVALKDGGIAISNDAAIDERGAASRTVWHSGQVIKDAATSKYGGSSLVKYKKPALNNLAKLHFGTYVLPAIGS